MLHVNLDENEVRAYLIEEIQKLDKIKLIEVYQFIARSFASDLINKIADAEATDTVNPTSNTELISQYRKRKPYH